MIAFLFANVHALPVVARIAKPQPISHLFQSKEIPRVKYKSVYDGPFKHGSPMLTSEEDSAAICDSFACLHLPKSSVAYTHAN